MFNIKFILTFLICILFLGNGYAQQELKSRLDYYPELNGTVITDVLPDSKGNIWIASLGGLVRFDGYEFHWYHNDPKDNKTIGGLLTYVLYEDARGRIWIGGMGEVYCFIPELSIFKSYQIRPGFPSHGQPFITSISEDINGRVYFGVGSGIGEEGSNALQYFDENEQMLKGLEKELDREIRNVFFMTSDAAGRVFFMSLSGDFYIKDNGKLFELKSHFDPMNNNDFPNALIGGDENEFWFTTVQSNLYHIAGEEIESWSMSAVFSQDVTPGFPSPLLMNKEGRTMIGTSLGLITFDQENESFSLKKLDTDIQFGPSDFTVMNYDLFGNLWIGSNSRGLFKVPNKNLIPSFIHDPNDPSSITEGWINRIFEDAEGYIWAPSNNRGGFEGLNRIDPKTGTLTRKIYRDMFPGYHNVYAINRVSPYEILCHSDKGLFIYDLKSKAIRPTGYNENIVNLPYIFNVVTDSRGVLWFCTVDGVYKEGNGKSKFIDLSQYATKGKTFEHVSLVLESEKGVWALSNDGLYFIDDSSDAVERHGFDPAKGAVFSSQDINSLYEDSEGVLWVGTWQGGLNRYDPKSKEVKVYRLEDGLPSMSIQGILGDEKNGNLWLSTFSGLSRFDIKEEKFNNFGTQDGSQGRLFADGSYLETSEGLFAFGGSSGLNIFDPNDLLEDSKPPKIALTDFRAEDQAIRFRDSLTGAALQLVLDHDQNNIAIAYTGIHYDDPSRNKFAYKLEGFDKDWREVGNQRAAYYYDLPPGNYTFNLKAANSSGLWNRENASLSFSISPPWWQTWWAYTIYGFAFVLSIMLFDRLRKRQLLKKEHEKNKEKELAHAKEIEIAYENLKNTQSQLIHAEKMASLGGLTAGIAHEIQNPLNFVNNFSELSIDLLDEMEEEITQDNKEEVAALSEDIKQNLEKINHHGQRASRIVKSMLMHSRGSNGQMQATDLNALIKEYVNLAFHGMRASKTAINVSIDLQLDDTIGEVSLNPEDFSRVVLNLCKNAFDAMRDKILSEKDIDYKPTLKVKTYRSNKDEVEIDFEDNGPGVPKDLQEKLFQPFFTTKKGTEGTGLGLSITHDIIKSHHGTIRIVSQDNTFTRFEIRMPLKN